MSLHLQKVTACLLLATLLSSCAAPSFYLPTARTDSATRTDDSKRPALPTPLDIALTPLAIAYYLYNPFLDTQRPTESERFEQSAHQVARAPRS